MAPSGWQVVPGKSVAVGSEGAGHVIQAGSSAASAALLNRTVCLAGGGTFARYRTVRAADCVALPEGVTSSEAAAAFINPTTALCMLDTARSHGQDALIFTAAASSLGRMMHRLCVQENVEFIGVVRGPEALERVRAQGVRYAFDLTSESFVEQLTEAITGTGATLAFDAIAGGDIVSTLLRCMESASRQSETPSGHYGSARQKRVYIFGNCWVLSTVLKRDFGLSYSVSGWLLYHYLDNVSQSRRLDMQRRVVEGLSGIFSTEYVAEISLLQLLDPDVMRAYAAKETAGKHLLRPHA